MMAVCVMVLSALHWSMYFCNSLRIMLGVFCFPLLLIVGTQPSISHGFSPSSSSPFASGTAFSFRFVDSAAVAAVEAATADAGAGPFGARFCFLKLNVYFACSPYSSFACFRRHWKDLHCHSAKPHSSLLTPIVPAASFSARSNSFFHSSPAALNIAWFRSCDPRYSSMLSP